MYVCRNGVSPGRDTVAVTSIDELKPVYLIFGKEDLLLERALLRLRERIAAVADLDFNFEAFDGETADATRIVAAANTVPFASERRLVVVRNVDKMRAADQALLTAYVENPAPSACLVLVAGAMPKTARLYKAVAALGGAAEYKAPTRGEYPGWVADLFASRGRRITRDGADALVAAVGRDLRRLEIETEKVIAFAGERTDLERVDIESVVAGTAPVSVFEFLDTLGARQCGPVLRLLDDLIDAGESLPGIHAMTVRHLRTLTSARALLDRGAARADIQRELRLGDWQLGKALEQARRFTAEELRDALREAADIDRKMKSGQGDERVVFEVWLAGVCQRAE